MSGRHTGKVSGTASGSNDDLDATGGGIGRVLGHVGGGAMSGSDFHVGLNAEVVAQELETGHQGLEVTVGAHDDGDGGGGLGDAGLLGLGANVAALRADVVDDVDERLDVGFGFVHGRGGDGDVTHLAAGFGGALAVEVDAGVGDGEGRFGGLEVGVRGGAADDVQHDGGLADLETLRGDGEVKDGADVGFELRHGAALDGVVARVVDTAGDLTEEKAVVFQEEHLHAEDTLAFKGGHGFPGQFLRFAVDGVGDVAGGGVDELADGVFLDGFNGGVGEDFILGLHDHDGEFLWYGVLDGGGGSFGVEVGGGTYHLEVGPFLGIQRTALEELEGFGDIVCTAHVEVSW